MADNISVAQSQRDLPALSILDKVQMADNISVAQSQSKQQPTLKLILIVDKDRRKVIFAEARKAVVDVLFSPQLTLVLRFGKLYISPLADRKAEPRATSSHRDGRFVEDERLTYVVTDDLVVKPLSDNYCHTLLKKSGAKNMRSLEVMTVDLDMNKVQEILKASFQSTTVLSDVFLPTN